MNHEKISPVNGMEYFWLKDYTVEKGMQGCKRVRPAGELLIEDYVESAKPVDFACVTMGKKTCRESISDAFAAKDKSDFNRALSSAVEMLDLHAEEINPDQCFECEDGIRAASKINPRKSVWIHSDGFSTWIPFDSTTKNKLTRVSPRKFYKAVEEISSRVNSLIGE